MITLKQFLAENEIDLPSDEDEGVSSDSISSVETDEEGDSSDFQFVTDEENDKICVNINLSFEVPLSDEIDKSEIESMVQEFKAQVQSKLGIENGAEQLLTDDGEEDSE